MLSGEVSSAWIGSWLDPFGKFRMNKTLVRTGMKRTLNLNMLPVAAVSLLLLAAPSWLSASPLVVNFDVNFQGNGIAAPLGGPGTYTGLAAGPGPGTFWNAADGGYAGAGNTPVTSNGSVFLSDGTAPTSIAFSVSNGYGYYGGTGNALLDDFATAVNAVGNFSLTNVPAGTYDVYVYAINGNFGGSSTAISLSSGTPDGGISTTVYPLPNSDTSFVEGVNYVLFHGVTPVRGTITGTYAGANGHTEGDFSGIQLVQSVPEPSTLILGGMAGLGLLAMVRRRGVLRND